MRRLTSQIGIILLALLLGGWGEVFAVVLCPHAMGQDHACCREKIESAPTEHHSGSHHQTAQGTKHEHRTHASHHRGTQATLVRAAGSSCAHCMGQRDLPAAPAGVRELTAQKSGAGKLAAHTTKILAQPATVTISRFAPTQHAPPGPAGRTHLLLSVFLI